MFENQNLYALTSEDRYTSGFSHGEERAAIDFQNNSPFNPACVDHTGYYCAGYFNGYNVTWNNLATNSQRSNPNTHTPTSNTGANPHTIISSSTDSRVGTFIISVSVVTLLLLQ